MTDWMSHQRFWHWCTFAAAFLCVGLWESFWPFRVLMLPTGKRWAAHIALATLANVLAFLMPMSAALVELFFEPPADGTYRVPGTAVPEDDDPDHVDLGTPKD